MQVNTIQQSGPSEAIKLRGERLKAAPLQSVASDTGIVLRRGSTAVKISGYRAAEVVKLVLKAAANGDSTCEEICRLFSNPSRPVVKNLIQQLCVRGFLTVIGSNGTVPRETGTRGKAGRNLGILRKVEELPVAVDAPNFFYFFAETYRDKCYFTGGGASTDRKIAMAKAVGEAVERYCSAVYNSEVLPLGSFRSATVPCVAPSEFALYSPQQYKQYNFPYAPFHETTRLRWAPTVDLTTGNNCFVPASMVFGPYLSQSKEEKAISQQISTGLACHRSPSLAAIAAICEVIERDAIAITWQAMLARPQILVETLSASNQGLLERFKRIGGTVTIIDVTLDHGVPVMLSILRNENRAAPALLFAAAAHLDPEAAVRKSLEELALASRFAREITTQHCYSAPGYEDVASPQQHVKIYCDHQNSKLADFVFRSRKRVAFEEIQKLSTSNPEKDLHILIDRISAVNHRVLIADLTRRDVRDLGLSVVRAVIPGFHPLFMGHRFRALGGSRLWRVPQKLGYKGISVESGDNPAPHPFP